MERIALIANSKITNYSLIKPIILQNDKVIAVDGGLNHCETMGITPDLIIGDLDSANESSIQKYAAIPTKIYPNDKDHSDLELAVIECLQDNPKIITLFGVLENRIDHTLSNLYLLTRYPGKIVIESDHETVHCITGFQEIACQPGQQISLIALPSPCIGVTTSGLKWELAGQTLDQSFFSLSNVSLKSSCSIEVREGTLLCCLSRH